MKSKKMIVIPSVSAFRKALEIPDREMNGAVFFKSELDYAKAASAELNLSRLQFIEIVGWYTNGTGYQRGSHRIKKLFDSCNKSTIDIVICYSREDFLEYKNSLYNAKESLSHFNIPVYCMEDCTIIKGGGIIKPLESGF